MLLTDIWIAKSGGSSIQVGTQFAGVSGAFEWSTALGLNYQMKKTTTVVGGDVSSLNQITDYESQIKSKLDFVLGLDGQFNLNTELSVGAGVAMNFRSKEEISYSDFDGNATARTNAGSNKGFTDITLGLNTKYVVTPNMMLGLNYAHVFAADVDGTMARTSTGTTTNYTTTMADRKDDRFGFDVSVRF